MPDPIVPALYAPQARLVDLASGQVIGTNVTSAASGHSITTTTIVSADLISARATLPNTGVGQLAITLNNQRFMEGKPIFPPWKYNDFSAPSKLDTAHQDAVGTFGLTLGQRVRLDLRYSTGPWVKMMIARITDLAFSFPSSGAAQLQITGEDMLSALKIRPLRDLPYDNRQEEFIASATVSAAHLNVPVRSEGIVQRDQPLRSARHLKSQTYFQFLTDMASRLDCELYTDFVSHLAEEDRRGKVSDGRIDVASELRVVMEPARSTLPPSTKVTDWSSAELARGEYVELRWGLSLIDFSPRLKVWEMPTSSVASGSDPGRRGRARGEVSSAELQTAIQRELPRSPSYDAAPVDAITARSQFFGHQGDTDSNLETSHGSGLDPTRTRQKALAQVLAKVREFMTAEASVVGLPMLRPGMYVHILGLRPPFDGFYYLTKAVHTLDGNGYRTQISLRRPGMLPPGAYQTPAREERVAAALPGGP
jgi:hypothetical protein